MWPMRSCSMKWHEQPVVDVARAAACTTGAARATSSSISSPISAPGTPERISGSWTYRCTSRTSASAIWPIAWRVDPGELQEGGRRQPHVEHRGDVAQHLARPRRSSARRRRLSPRRPGSAGSCGLQARAAGDLAHRVAGLGAPQEVLDRPDRQLAGVAGVLDLLERVPAGAQPRDDPHVGGCGQRPVSVVAGDEALLDPAPDGPGRDARRGRLPVERQLAPLGHGRPERSTALLVVSGRRHPHLPPV